MTASIRGHHEGECEAGFALLVLLGVIASGSLAIVLAVEVLVPFADAGARAESHVATAESAARDRFRRSGAFPASVDDLVTGANGPVLGPWRRDPWGGAADLDYGMVANTLRIRSRGADGQLDTGDDIVASVGTESLLRARQRARLRLIRAAFARSSYRWAATMTNAEAAAVVAAMRDYAIARRSYLTADAATRATLTTRMDDARTTVSTITAAHGCAPLPPAVTGAGGLMEGLGMPDSRAVDGGGVPLILDSTVGVVAVGADRTGGTADDM